MRPRRRRAKLRELIAAFDAIHERTKADPLACEVALTAELKRARVRLVRGELDDGILNAVALHVHELVGGARRRLLTSRYASLSPGALAALQESLADGVVTRVERDHVLRALAADATLSAEERARLTRLVEEWYSADGGSG